MKKSDLNYQYPSELIATEPVRPSRILFVDKNPEVLPREIEKIDLFKQFTKGDVLVINQTKVVPRRVFVQDDKDDLVEFLFLESLADRHWHVLFPAKKYKLNAKFKLPGGGIVELISKGRPQTILAEQDLSEAYFEKHAELPLPPYIQQARGQRHNLPEDKKWYQTAWAKEAGSFAAPTASLHFSQEDLLLLEQKGVEILKLTLHVGLGTFLPITAEDLTEHQMHSEFISIEKTVVEKIQQAKANGHHIWAIGTTAARSLESWALDYLKLDLNTQVYSGTSDLFIKPGFQWQIVDRLLTNFHQPESTLLALVAAFSDLNRVKAVYQFAIQERFRLFSYGDLSVWEK